MGFRRIPYKVVGIAQSVEIQRCFRPETGSADILPTSGYVIDHIAVNVSCTLTHGSFGSAGIDGELIEVAVVIDSIRLRGLVRHDIEADFTAVGFKHLALRAGRCGERHQSGHNQYSFFHFVKFFFVRC